MDVAVKLNTKLVKEKRKMKKFVALFVALVLCLSMSTAAFAENAINWSDVEAIVEQAGWQGEFKTFDEIAVQVWIPVGLKEVELTEEDTEAGYIGYYMTDDESACASVVYVNYDGGSLEDYAAFVAENGGTEIEIGTVNGLPCVSYVFEENDACCVAFTTEMGYILEVSCIPYSDEEFRNIAGVIAASIQPAE